MAVQEMGSEIEDEFVKSIKKNYESLNNNEKFKEQFKDETFKILLNPKDGEFAAIISVDKGIVSVHGMKNTPKEDISKEIVGWDGYMQTTRQNFREIGDGTLSSKDIRKKFLTRKIKGKGLEYLKYLSQMSALRRDIEE